MKQRVIVLGAGMVGTCSAIHLALRGHEVLLVDRGDPGRETSYGNAGLIQREAVEPYPFPREWTRVARAAARLGVDVNYHFDALPAIARPLARYWLNSAPAAHARASAAYERLIAHCLTEHQFLMDRIAADDLVRRDGYLWVFRHESTFQEARARARRLAEDSGVRHVVLETEAVRALQPMLQTRLPAIHWLDPWAVNDPGELVARYAALFRQSGGHIVTGDALTLAESSTGWQVRTAEGVVDAPHAVVALGPWSDALLRRLGYRWPLFVKRGYHRHYRMDPAPPLAMLDADSGFVLAPMRTGVRLTTGAEFARIDAPATPVQLRRAEVLARGLLPLGEPVEATPWLGARPCTADMLPVIGAAPRHPGLWLNFGHAHQGFTLGPVSGRLIAELVDGSPTLVPLDAYAPTRF
ncbi:FAD-binding oxidoreductase [Ramlibacter sp. AW1]|uniref:FAD-binding oxidoreductase n=1 Tax=Ramlibacter aurantiacus TaxID=2801330 RepID=A0A936ZH12_9BURK|nr:FAD-dependent oxidoreductase [Ramlibacter aurantiacus]MBL0419702.1 FAD-binding oxidoreductase [Ramlibacter aurantiacus]